MRIAVRSHKKNATKPSAGVAKNRQANGKSKHHQEYKEWKESGRKLVCGDAQVGCPFRDARDAEYCNTVVAFEKQNVQHTKSKASKTKRNAKWDEQQVDAERRLRNIWQLLYGSGDTIDADIGIEPRRVIRNDSSSHLQGKWREFRGVLQSRVAFVIATEERELANLVVIFDSGGRLGRNEWLDWIEIVERGNAKESGVAKQPRCNINGVVCNSLSFEIGRCYSRYRDSCNQVYQLRTSKTEKRTGVRNLKPFDNWSNSVILTGIPIFNKIDPFIFHAFTFMKF